MQTIMSIAASWHWPPYSDSFVPFLESHSNL